MATRRERRGLARRSGVGRGGADAGCAQSVAVGQAAAGQAHCTAAGVGVTVNPTLARRLHGDGPWGDAQQTICVSHVVIA